MPARSSGRAGPQRVTAAAGPGGPVRRRRHARAGRSGDSGDIGAPGCPPRRTRARPPGGQRRMPRFKVVQRTGPLGGLLHPHEAAVHPGGLHQRPCRGRPYGLDHHTVGAHVDVPGRGVGGRAVPGRPVQAGLGGVQCGQGVPYDHGLGTARPDRRRVGGVGGRPEGPEVPQLQLHGGSLLCGRRTGKGLVRTIGGTAGASTPPLFETIRRARPLFPRNHSSHYLSCR